MEEWYYFTIYMWMVEFLTHFLYFWSFIILGGVFGLWLTIYNDLFSRLHPRWRELRINEEEGCQCCT